MSTFRKFRSEHWLAVLGGLILTLFLTSLLLINYRSQIKLQDATMTHMMHELEKHATSVKYYFLERRQDISGLSQAWELISYFTRRSNTAHESDLRFSRMQIINRFDFLIHDRRFNGSRVFQGITLLDTRGGKLAGSGIDIPEGYVNEFLDLKNNTPKQEVRFNTMNNGENLKIFANTPFLYRGVCHGFIVAQLNIETVVTGGIHSGHEPEEFPMYIEFGRQDDIITYPLQLTEITQPIFNSAELGPKRFTINQSGHRGYFEYIGMKIGIDGTPFFLGQACPAAISGYNRPILLLIIMGVMSLVISGAAFVFWRTSHRELRLRANLAEEQSLKQEITSRNQQLETEIQTRIKLEQTLKDSEAKFRKICTAAQDAIIMLDNRGKVCFWNQAASDIFEWTEEEALSLSFCAGLSPEEDHLRFKTAFEAFSKTGKRTLGRTIELKARRKKGGDFPAEISFSSVKLSDRWHLIAIVRDISKRKIAEEELKNHRKNLEKFVRERTRELQKAQDILVNKALEAGRVQLSAMMLHNIGNAITPVSLAVSKLRKNYDGQVQSYLEKCYEDMYEFREDLSSYITQNPRGRQVFQLLGELVAELAIDNRKSKELLKKVYAGIEYVSTILMASRAYAPTIKETLEQVNINKLLEDAIYIQEDCFSKRKIQIKKELAPNLPGIVTEKNKFMQVVINLLKNACDAIDANTDRKDHQITVRTGMADNCIIFELSDTGIGVSEDRVQDIFQFGISTKGSSGFGLYYAKTFVESASGTLSLISEGKGLGTTFIISFPLNRKNSHLKHGSGENKPKNVDRTNESNR